MYRIISLKGIDQTQLLTLEQDGQTVNLFYTWAHHAHNRLLQSLPT